MSELTTVYLDLIMVFVVVVCWGLAFVFPVVVLLCALTCPETLCVNHGIRRAMLSYIG